jgi:hypothetical protein
MPSGLFDGARRNHFFPEVETIQGGEVCRPFFCAAIFSMSRGRLWGDWSCGMLGVELRLDPMEHGADD